jgi:hypothetical protein
MAEDFVTRRLGKLRNSITSQPLPGPNKSFFTRRERTSIVGAFREVSDVVTAAQPWIDALAYYVLGIGADQGLLAIGLLENTQEGAETLGNYRVNLQLRDNLVQAPIPFNTPPLPIRILATQVGGSISPATDQTFYYTIARFLQVPGTGAPGLIADIYDDVVQDEILQDPNGRARIPLLSDLHTPRRGRNWSSYAGDTFQEMRGNYKTCIQAAVGPAIAKAVRSMGYHHLRPFFPNASARKLFQDRTIAFLNPRHVFALALTLGHPMFLAGHGIQMRTVWRRCLSPLYALLRYLLDPAHPLVERLAAPHQPPVPANFPTLDSIKDDTPAYRDWNNILKGPRGANFVDKALLIVRWCSRRQRASDIATSHVAGQLPRGWLGIPLCPFKTSLAPEFVRYSYRMLDNLIVRSSIHGSKKYRKVPADKFEVPVAWVRNILGTSVTMLMLIRRTMILYRCQMQTATAARIANSGIES